MTRPLLPDLRMLKVRVLWSCKGCNLCEQRLREIYGQLGKVEVHIAPLFLRLAMLSGKVVGVK
jgi:hypothetical protein